MDFTPNFGLWLTCFARPNGVS